MAQGQQVTEQKKMFDLTVTHRDPITGQITDRTPYTLRVIQRPEGGKQQIFERPVGSGNIFTAQGDEFGRWVIDAETKEGRHDPKAKHIAFKMPETKDQKLARELLEKDAAIAELKRELDAIKLEKEKSSKGAVVKSKES